MLHANSDPKEIITAQAKARLREFLDSDSLFHLPRPTHPQLSILLVLYNRAELTLTCLQSLQSCLQETAAEIVLVDNASRDETSILLDRIRGATIIRNRDNAGFPVAVNQAAEAAAGELLLLLNNDTEVLDDSVNDAVRFLADNPDVGAVGGRLILLDGMLQEAGCTLWREGHVFQYGRGDSPTAAEYQFQRDVDYCSGAFLMTRRELFHKMGGLDPAFSPGYFEDVDYCVRLWRCGWRTVYLPEVAVRHYENASSACHKSLNHLYRRNHVLFCHKHADWLCWQCPSVSTPPLWARSSHDDRFKVLYLPTKGSSWIAQTVDRLRSLNCFVTVFPVSADAFPPANEDHPTLPADVEVLPGGGLDTLPRLLADRGNYYDRILASDPRVLEQIKIN
ncbi:MAG TPA: glycosyltransferase family 2 protein [Gemmataceae bacterium]|nr:glycosyltransferase family 2 protein [Gemmataceae bacterium]